MNAKKTKYKKLWKVLKEICGDRELKPFTTCPFWTTNYLATGYCRFSNEECHTSKACLHMDRSVNCETYKLLMKLIVELKLNLDTFFFFPKGKNVK